MVFMSFGLRTEKFTVVSKDYGRMHDACVNQKFTNELILPMDYTDRKQLSIIDNRYSLWGRIHWTLSQVASLLFNHVIIAWSRDFEISLCLQLWIYYDHHIAQLV